MLHSSFAVSQAMSIREDLDLNLTSSSHTCTNAGYDVHLSVSLSIDFVVASSQPRCNVSKPKTIELNAIRLFTMRSLRSPLICYTCAHVRITLDCISFTIRSRCKSCDLRITLHFHCSGLLLQCQLCWAITKIRMTINTKARKQRQCSHVTHKYTRAHRARFHCQKGAVRRAHCQQDAMPIHRLKYCSHEMLWYNAAHNGLMALHILPTWCIWLEDQLKNHCSYDFFSRTFFALA